MNNEHLGMTQLNLLGPNLSLHFNFQLLFFSPELSSWASFASEYRKTVAKQFHVIAFICPRIYSATWVSGREHASNVSEWAEKSFRETRRKKFSFLSRSLLLLLRTYHIEMKLFSLDIVREQNWRGEIMWQRTREL